ncbi:MAG TPA: sialidase family protein [Candidatus Thermoplasmatota archaeon]|nr:sialidase family protein [Candidatus Thermoplasmatota archaeon]
MKLFLREAAAGHSSDRRLFDCTGRVGQVRAGIALVLLAPALAGCFGAPVDPLSDADTSLAQPVFRYLCAGDNGDGSADPCLAQLPRGDAMLQQPYVAIHPGNPNIMAVGAHYANPPAELAVGLVSGDASGTRIAVYLTEDGGATWRESFATPPAMNPGPLDLVHQGDAALLFDPEGRLHVTALARVERAGDTEDLNGVNGLRTYYVRSDDLGRTWGEPVWLGTDDVGHTRNWIVRDPASGALYVVWFDGSSDFSEQTTFVAWSRDGGATWRAQEPGQRPSCHRLGAPVVLDGVLRFACTRFAEGEGVVVQIYAFDASDGHSTLLAELDEVGDAAYTFLTLLADGTLAMHYDDCRGWGTTFAPNPPNPCPLDSPLLRSADAGLTWNAVGSALSLATGDWHRGRVFWSEADPFGDQHLLVRYERDEPLGPADPTGRVFTPVAYEARHLVLDGRGALVHSVVLETWRSEVARADEWVPGLDDEGRQREGHPRCAGMSCFNGIGWAGDRGLIAFAHDGAVKLALVTRDGPPLRALPPIEAPPIRAYVPPPPPRGLDEPIEREFTGRADFTYCYASEPAPVAELGSEKFEFDVPPDTRYVDGTLRWANAGPVADLDLMLYDAEGDAFDAATGDVPETFHFELHEGDQGAWTALVYNCENLPTDFTLSLELS